MKGRHERRLCQETSRRLPRSLLAQKSSKSEKPVYPNPDLKNLHIQKLSKGLKTGKMSERLNRSTFYRTHKKYISKINRSTFKSMEDENHMMKNLQKQNKLVRKTKDKNNKLI